MATTPTIGFTVPNDNQSTVQPTEYSGQVTWSPALAIFMAVIACTGTAGNILIIGSVFIEKRLRVLSNAFIVNLAIADLIVTSYVMPVGIATSQYKLKPFSDALCDFNAFVMITTCSISTQTLMLIAIERYIHVCHATVYGKLFTRRTVTIYIAIAWIYTMVGSAQGWTGWTIYYYGHDYFLCLFYGPESFSYDICLSIFGFVLPVLVLTFCYVSIYKLVQKSKRAMESYQKATKSTIAKQIVIRKQQARENRFIIMMVTIVIVFCIMWAPGATVMALSGALGENEVPILAYTITVWFALCNSAMNSIIYGIMNTNFRRGYKAILRRIFCCACKEREEKKSSTNNGDAVSQVKSANTSFSTLPSSKQAKDRNSNRSSGVTGNST